VVKSEQVSNGSVALAEGVAELRPPGAAVLAGAGRADAATGAGEVAAWQPTRASVPAATLTTTLRSMARSFNGQRFHERRTDQSGRQRKRQRGRAGGVLIQPRP
jgi:hypothetical protein